jgi:hypothetical protein
MLCYINLQTKQQIPQSFQDAFIEDVLEDLEQIDVNRIAGLGITPEQLYEWVNATN